MVTLVLHARQHQKCTYRRILLLTSLHNCHKLSGCWSLYIYTILLTNLVRFLTTNASSLRTIPDGSKSNRSVTTPGQNDFWQGQKFSWARKIMLTPHYWINVLDDRSVERLELVQCINHSSTMRTNIMYSYLYYTIMFCDCLKCAAYTLSFSWRKENYF